MPVYRLKIPGAKPVLIKASSAAQARDALVELESLNGEDAFDAMAAGEKVWQDGDKIEAEAPPKPEVKPDIKPDSETETKTELPATPPAGKGDSK